MSKYESKISHTFGKSSNGGGHDNLTPKGIIYPHGHSDVVAQPHRTVNAKHEEICGASGMESHGKVSGSNSGLKGKGGHAEMKSDVKVPYRESE